MALDATWPEILANASAIRAYHLDLFATLWKGKSPTAEQARKVASRERQAREMAEMLAHLDPDDAKDAERAMTDAVERQKLANIAKAGFHVATTVEPALAQIDLFKEFARRKALAAAEARGGRDR